MRIQLRRLRRESLGEVWCGGSLSGSSFLLLIAMPFVPSSFLLLVARPGAPSSVLVSSSDALCS